MKIFLLFGEWILSVVAVLAIIFFGIFDDHNSEKSLANKVQLVAHKAMFVDGVSFVAMAGVPNNTQKEEDIKKVLRQMEAGVRVELAKSRDQKPLFREWKVEMSYGQIKEISPMMEIKEGRPVVRKGP